MTPNRHQNLLKKDLCHWRRTGLRNLLRGLRDHCKNITAVVTMTDDGVSLLRRLYELCYWMMGIGAMSDNYSYLFKISINKNYILINF